MIANVSNLSLSASILLQLMCGHFQNLMGTQEYTLEKKGLLEELIYGSLHSLHFMVSPSFHPNLPLSNYIIGFHLDEPPPHAVTLANTEYNSIIIHCSQEDNPSSMGSRVNM